MPRSRELEGTDGKVRREDGAVPSPAAYFPSLHAFSRLCCVADDIGEVARVLAVEALRQKDADVPADDLGFGIAEHPLAGVVEGLDIASVINGDKAIDRIVDDGCEHGLGAF